MIECSVDYHYTLGNQQRCLCNSNTSASSLETNNGRSSIIGAKVGVFGISLIRKKMMMSAKVVNDDDDDDYYYLKKKDEDEC